MESQTKRIVANSASSFFDQYEDAIRKGFTPVDRTEFHYDMISAIQTGFWKTHMEYVFDPAPFLEIGLEKLSFADLCFLSEAIDAKASKSRDGKIFAIKDKLGMVEEVSPAPIKNNKGSKKRGK